MPTRRANLSPVRYVVCLCAVVRSVGSHLGSQFRSTRRNIRIEPATARRAKPEHWNIVEHTGILEGWVSVPPARFAELLGKSGEPTGTRTPTPQIKSLVQSVVTDGQPLSLLTESVLHGHAYAGCS